MFGALLLSVATALTAQQLPALQAGLPSVQPVPPPPVQLSVPDEIAGSMPDPAQGLIRIDVTVTDKAGKPVSGLTEKDFTLLDNDQQEKIVTLDGAHPATPVDIVIMIDELNMPVSEQVRKKVLSQTEMEVETFLRANGGVLRHPVMIYRLTQDGLFASQRASLDGNQLAEEVENPKNEYQIWKSSMVSKDIVEHIGKEVMDDSGHLPKEKTVAVEWRITRSLVALGSIALEERRKTGRKLMFWMGNGWQIEKRKAGGLSDFSIELLTRIREARITLWGASEWPLYDDAGNTLPVDDHANKEYMEGPQSKLALDPTDLNYLSLPLIAARTGGGMIAIPRNLAGAIGERVREANQFYSLTFDPPRTNAVDEYHNLRVAIGRQDLSAHSCLDYFDQPVFYDQAPVHQRVSVEKLQDSITESHDASDSELAKQLEGMELTERLSTPRLIELQNRVRGKKARETLETVADESMFLPPPPEEIPSTPKPDLSTQSQMISRTIDYLHTTIPKLPDVFATRTTVQYHEFPTKQDETWKTATGDESLHEGEIEEASIKIRNGREQEEKTSRKNVSDKPGGQMLRTIGTFGPILVTVIAAATSPQSEIVWSRWEKGADGPLAVFRYRVPHETPFFSAEFCCLAVDFANVPFQTRAPFHGEFAVDPTSGAIMRLTIQSDLEWRLPLHRSDVMVEYASVVRGTRTFICPSRSVSISRQRKTMVIHEWGEGFKVYAPFETILNEMRFEKYRIFGSTSRILPDFTELPAKK